MLCLISAAHRSRYVSPPRRISCHCNKYDSYCRTVSAYAPLGDMISDREKDGSPVPLSTLPKTSCTERSHCKVCSRFKANVQGAAENESAGESISDCDSDCTIRVTSIPGKKWEAPHLETLLMKSSVELSAPLKTEQISTFRPSPSDRKLHLRVRADHYCLNTSPSTPSIIPCPLGPPAKTLAPSSKPLSYLSEINGKSTHTHDAPGLTKIPHLLSRSGHVRRLWPRRSVGKAGIHKIVRSGFFGYSRAQAIQDEYRQLDAVDVHPAESHELVMPDCNDTHTPASPSPAGTASLVSTRPPSPASPNPRSEDSPSRPLQRRHRSLPSFNNYGGLYCPGRDELRAVERRASDPGPGTLKSASAPSLQALRHRHSLDVSSAEPRGGLLTDLPKDEGESNQAPKDEAWVGTQREDDTVREVHRIHRSPSLDPVLEVDESLSVQPGWAREFEDFINDRESTDDEDTVEEDDDAEDEDSDDDVAAWTGLLSEPELAPTPGHAIDRYLAFLQLPMREGTVSRGMSSRTNSVCG